MLRIARKKSESYENFTLNFNIIRFGFQHLSSATKDCATAATTWIINIATVARNAGTAVAWHNTAAPARFAAAAIARHNTAVTAEHTATAVTWIACAAVDAPNTTATTHARFSKPSDMD